ncbi:preprotein translocase subunit SecG [Candidatus Parcubacteria bacterium]|nr:preprotein translocase subunit SecG [Candidatus Parcubacteria bacterium]
MPTLLSYIQVVLSILLLCGVLLQRSEAGLGSAFGADGMNSTRYTRRGFEKFLFIGTITVAVLFVISSFASLFFRA